MCGGGGSSAPTVDAQQERLDAEAEATAKTNLAYVAKARQKRRARGLLSSAEPSDITVLTDGYKSQAQKDAEAKAKANAERRAARPSIFDGSS